MATILIAAGGIILSLLSACFYFFKQAKQLCPRPIGLQEDFENELRAFNQKFYQEFRVQQYQLKVCYEAGR